MNRRVTGAALALLLALGVPAGAAAAAESSVTQSVTFMGTTQPPSSAPLPEARITSDQAETAVKQFFTLPQKSDRVELNWNLSSQGTKRTWDLQVMVRDANGGGSGGSIASVDAVTGRILRYGFFGMIPGPLRTGPLAPVHTADEARAKAWSLVKELAPEQAAQLKEAPAGSPDYSRMYYGLAAGGGADDYSFTWTEYHDGVPFPDSSVMVSVNKQTLEYRSVSVNLLDSLKFQAGPAKVTADEAMKLWQGETKPTLAYQGLYSGMPYGPGRPTEYKLLYSFPNAGRAVDAMTGAWAKDPSPMRPPQPDAKPAAPEAVPAGSGAPVGPSTLPLTDEAARHLALGILTVPEGADLRSDNNFYSDEKLIRLSYFDKNGNGTVEFEPKTGLLRNANRYQRTDSPPPQPGTTPPSKPEPKPVTPEQEAQAKQAAFTVVQTYYSQLRDQLQLVPAPHYWGPPGNQMRQFYFTRFVNGLAVPNNMVMVSIDLSTMKWVNMSAGWSTGVTFPSPAQAVSPDTALATMMVDRKPLLTYRPVYPTVSPDQPYQGMPQPTEAALVYVLTPSATSLVDALTGQAVGYDGMPASDLQAAFKKVTGHWAEGELQFMLARRVVTPEQLNPEGALTRAQAVSLLLSRNQRTTWMRQRAELPYTDLPDTDPAYGAVRTAWVEGWLRPIAAETTFRPTATISRAEFAVWAVRALGFGDLARSALTVQNGYTDVSGLSSEQRNAANFLRALGVLAPGDTFRGGEPLTQAEGAALTVRIYNYLLTR